MSTQNLTSRYNNYSGKGWRSGESTRLPPMCPLFDSRTQCSGFSKTRLPPELRWALSCELPAVFLHFPLEKKGLWGPYYQLRQVLAKGEHLLQILLKALQHHLRVEFVVGSLLCSERFLSRYSGFPSSSKPTFPNFSWILECTDTSE